MNIGMDFDDTFTRDPEGWATFMRLMAGRGHNVYITTWRCPGAEAAEVIASMAYYKTCDAGIYCTSRKAKEKYMFEQGICIDVWIDDNPRAILHTMEGWE